MHFSKSFRLQRTDFYGFTALRIDLDVSWTLKKGSEPMLTVSILPAKKRRIILTLNKVLKLKLKKAIDTIDLGLLIKKKKNYKDMMSEG